MRALRGLHERPMLRGCRAAGWQARLLLQQAPVLLQVARDVLARQPLDIHHLQTARARFAPTPRLTVACSSGAWQHLILWAACALGHWLLGLLQKSAQARQAQARTMQTACCAAAQPECGAELRCAGGHRTQQRPAAVPARTPADNALCARHGHGVAQAAGVCKLDDHAIEQGLALQGAGSQHVQLGWS